MDQYAQFPIDYMCLSQGRWGTYSHKNQNAYDFSKGGERKALIAPYDYKAVFKDASWGCLVIQSTAEVAAPNGRTAAQWMALLHNESAYPNIGESGRQGTPFYHMGKADPWGTTTGTHVHIECGFGAAPASWAALRAATHANIEDCLYLPAGIAIANSGGYGWKNLPAAVPGRFSKGKSFRLFKASLYGSSSAQKKGSLSGMVYLRDGKKVNGRYRVAALKADIGESGYPARWVNEAALLSKRVLGAGVPFVLCEAISTYAASGSRSEKGTVKGKVWVMDGIIINGRIRVVTGKEYVGKAPSAESNKIWVTVSSLQKYGI